MRQIDHPNIVQLIDFSESRQYYYIVLELCPGGELFHQIVRLTYFSEELSRHVIVQVAEALEYLHETGGVVHRYASLLSLARLAADSTEGTSSLKTFSFIPFPSSPRETLNPGRPKTKTKPTKENLSEATERVGLERSRLPILDCRKLSGTVKP